MRNNCRDYLVMTQKVFMCLLRCDERRCVYASVSTVWKIFFELHNNYPDFCVTELNNDG